MPTKKKSNNQRGKKRANSATPAGAVSVPPPVTPPPPPLRRVHVPAAEAEGRIPKGIGLSSAAASLYTSKKKLEMDPCPTPTSLVKAPASVAVMISPTSPSPLTMVSSAPIISPPPAFVMEHASAVGVSSAAATSLLQSPHAHLALTGPELVQQLYQRPSQETEAPLPPPPPVLPVVTGGSDDSRLVVTLTTADLRDVVRSEITEHIGTMLRALSNRQLRSAAYLFNLLRPSGQKIIVDGNPNADLDFSVGDDLVGVKGSRKRSADGEVPGAAAAVPQKRQRSRRPVNGVSVPSPLPEEVTTHMLSQMLACVTIRLLGDNFCTLNLEGRKYYASTVVDECFILMGISRHDAASHPARAHVHKVVDDFLRNRVDHVKTIKKELPESEWLPALYQFSDVWRKRAYNPVVEEPTEQVVAALCVPGPRGQGWPNRRNFLCALGAVPADGKLTAEKKSVAGLARSSAAASSSRNLLRGLADAEREFGFASDDECDDESDVVEIRPLAPTAAGPPVIDVDELPSDSDEDSDAPARFDGFGKPTKPRSPTPPAQRTPGVLGARRVSFGGASAMIVDPATAASVATSRRGHGRGRK